MLVKIKLMKEKLNFKVNMKFSRKGCFSFFRRDDRNKPQPAIYYIMDIKYSIFPNVPKKKIYFFPVFICDSNRTVMLF